MCLIIHWTCQKCKRNTGQHDYLRHTDAQCFAIPAWSPLNSSRWFPLIRNRGPASYHSCDHIWQGEAVSPYNVISFCDTIRHRHMPILDPLLQSLESPCRNPACAGLKVQFNARKCEKQQKEILDVLRDTEYRAIHNGNAYMDVEAVIKSNGIETWNQPGMKLQKWTLYAEEKLKKMIADGDSYNQMKTALKAITGLNYTTYQIITKAASFDLYQALFPEKRANRRK